MLRSTRHALSPAAAFRGCTAAAALLLAGWVAPSPAAAQATVSGELAAFGANTLVGGATAGIVAWLRGESFVEAFGEGALGGSAMYVGKRLASAEFPGAGLVGRAVAATGSSVIRNSASGVGILDRLVLPVGPVTLYWTTPADSAGVRAKLDLGRAVFFGLLAFDEGLELDWGESFSAGAPVFRAPGRVIEGEGGAAIGGLELLGTISLSDPALLPPIDHASILAHERVHVLQDDFLSIAWADPVEDWLIGQVPGGETFGRYVDVGGVYLAMGAFLIKALPYSERPWEVEAGYLGGTR